MTNYLKKYVVFRLILYFVLNVFLYVPLSNKIRLPLCSVAFSHSDDIYVICSPYLGLGSALACLNRRVFLCSLRPHLHGDIFAGIRNVLAAFAPSVYTKTAKTIWKTDVFKDGFQSGSFRKRSHIVAM